MKQKLLILFTALMSAVSVSAYDFEYVYNGKTLYFNTTSDNTCEVTKGKNYAGKIVIPESLTYMGITYTVTAIGNEAFDLCSGVSSVNIPNTVTLIGDEAFDYCTGLTSVNIPNSVTTIGDRTFRACEKLTSMTIPNSVASIGDLAFSQCHGLTAFYGKFASEDNRCLISEDGTLLCIAPSGLTSYTIPNSVISIGHYAFGCYNKLTSISIPNSVTSIEELAFYQCKGLTSVYIPNSVTSIGDRAFDQCERITGISIPNSVISIGQAAFSYCSELISVTIPNSVVSLGTGLFCGCSSLTSVELPNSITSIGHGDFQSCKSLTSISIPNTVTSIGDYAFSGCFSLTSITIPESVTSIGESAFSYCKALISFTIPSSVTSIGHEAFYYANEMQSLSCLVEDPSKINVGVDVFIGVSKSTCKLYVPLGCGKLYQADKKWNSFEIEELNNVDLRDSTPYTNDTDLEDVSVKYSRTFIADIWQPLYVPFNMSYDECKDYGRVAELSCVHAYEDGRTTIEFVSVNSGELLPNVPYVFFPKAGGEITFTCTNKTLKAAPEEHAKYIMCSSPRYTFKIYGNYQPVSGSILATYGDPVFNGAYVMSKDNKFQHCSPSATLKPYRFYITREKSANGYWNSPARQNAPDPTDDDVIYFMVDGEVCGIADIVTDFGNSAIYDIKGREVKNPSNGIYIQNGKKIRIH